MTLAAGRSAPVAVGQELARAALVLARRFAGGATLWCVAPRAPEHAQHLAVEFVHPVIMGTRALPAVAVGDPDPAAALRAGSRSGDVLAVVADADDAVALDVLQRASAWGVTTIWLGTGDRPAPGRAGNVVWHDSVAPGGATGVLVTLYHVLWELTHVCFEHPGLVAPDVRSDAEVCVTCRDEGVVAEVVAVDGDEAEVRTADGRAVVDASLVGPVDRGALVLLHAGTAISRIEPWRP